MRKIIISVTAVLILFTMLFAVGCGNEISSLKSNDAVVPLSADVATSIDTVGGEAVAFPDTDITLIKDKKSAYKVIIGKNATRTEKYAAEELVYFLNESTGCELPVITDEEIEEGRRYISVGNTSLLGSAGLEPDYAELGDNGVSVYTRNGNVYIAGVAEYGTLFSVYRFLYYQIGYRAYAYDDIDYDYYNELKLKNFDYKYRPALGTVTAEDGEMSGKEKTKEALRMYIYASKNGGYNLDGNLYNGLWCHTTGHLASQSLYKDLWKNGQLCYSNPKSAEVVAESLISKYVDNAVGQYLMVGGEDSTGSCDCDDCKKNEEIYGGAAGVYSRFLNIVAEKIEDHLKSKGITKKLTIVGLFYYAYTKPPVKLENGKYVPVNQESVPRSAQVSVGVMYTPIGACYTHPFGDNACETNKPYTEYLEGWAAITDHLMMYAYGTNFQSFKLHFNNWSHEGDSFRFYSKLGMTYYFEQACCQNGISPMSSMRVYVRSRLAWNPYYDTQDLIDEFIEHYYGAGAEGVSEYFSTVMENYERLYIVENNECLGIYYTLSRTNLWTRPMLKNYQSYLEKATYAIEMAGGNKMNAYAERVFREYYLLKDNELRFYQSYLSGDELEETKALVGYGRQKYNVTRESE